MAGKTRPLTDLVCCPIFSFTLSLLGLQIAPLKAQILASSDHKTANGRLDCCQTRRAGMVVFCKTKIGMRPDFKITLSRRMHRSITHSTRQMLC